MSCDEKMIVKVDNLNIGILNEEDNKSYRFMINYGSFAINKGDFVLLKGHNGSGKSTFLRLFHLQGVDYFRIEQGGIYYCDDTFPNESIHKYSSHQLSRLNCFISYIGQEERFITSDSAYSYIYRVTKYALDEQDLSKEEKEKKIKEIDEVICDYFTNFLADSFKVKNYKIFKNKNVRYWSGGQQKMISVLAGIIKMKICGLKLLVMDEPLNNLDGLNKNILNNLIEDLRKDDIAIIAITHCQIFKGINKVLMIKEIDKEHHEGIMIEKSENPHTECLEDYN